MNFLIYKFLGDGWILIFSDDFDYGQLMPFIITLCNNYKKLSKRYLLNVLNITPQTMGLTFGIDRGTLTQMFMNQVTEYIGRPLNIACRLQNSISQKDDFPQYKVMMSKHTFSYLKENKNIDFNQFNPVQARRTLKNVEGSSEVQCIKLKVL
jgi:hypothetical protein